MSWNYTSSKIQSTSVYFEGTLYVYGGLTSSANRFLWLYDLTETHLVPEIPYNQISSNSFPPNLQAIFFVYTKSSKPQHQIMLYTPATKDSGSASFYDYMEMTSIVPNPTFSVGGPGARLGHGIDSNTPGNIWAFGGFNIDRQKNYHSGYFYHFRDDTNEWEDLTQLAVQNNVPNLAYHTLNNINGEFLVVLGGAQPDEFGTFTDNSFDKLYKFDIEKRVWTTHPLVNCPSKPRIGHSSTLVRGDLIVVGGTNKMGDRNSTQIYDDIFSLNLNNYTCTPLALLLPNNEPAAMQHAWHADTLVQDQLILTFGTSNSTVDPRMVIIDTNQWIIQDKFIQSQPIQAFNQILITEVNGSSPFQTILAYSLIGVLVLGTILFFFYCIIIKGKLFKKFRSKSNFKYFGDEEFSNFHFSQPEWINSDNFSIKLNYSTLFTLNQSNGSRTRLLQDTCDDLNQLNDPRLPYRRWSSDESTLRSHVVLDRPIPLGATRTLVNGRHSIFDKHHDETLLSQSDNQSDNQSDHNTDFTETQLFKTCL